MHTMYVCVCVWIRCTVPVCICTNYALSVFQKKKTKKVNIKEEGKNNRKIIKTATAAAAANSTTEKKV